MTLFRISLIKLTAIAIIFAACSKDDNPSSEIEDGKSTLIKDLAGDSQASISDGVDGKEKRPFYTFLYNLSEKKQIWVRTQTEIDQWAKTDKWDLAFTGNYNSDIYINNANMIGSPGHEGAVKNTAILLINQPYQLVTSAPSDSEFDQSNLTKIGMTDIKNTEGWYSYNETSHIMNALPDRTYVLRLTNGRFAKIQFMSTYKGNPPAVTDRYWPAPYLTFRYFIQQDGSRNLNTK